MLFSGIHAPSLWEVANYISCRFLLPAVVAYRDICCTVDGASARKIGDRKLHSHVCLDKGFLPFAQTFFGFCLQENQPEPLKQLEARS
jgi:hypothetical protein